VKKNGKLTPVDKQQRVLPWWPGEDGRAIALDVLIEPNAGTRAQQR